MYSRLISSHTPPVVQGSGAGRRSCRAGDRRPGRGRDPPGRPSPSRRYPSRRCRRRQRLRSRRRPRRLRPLPPPPPPLRRRSLLPRRRRPNHRRRPSRARRSAGAGRSAAAGPAPVPSPGFVPPRPGPLPPRTRRRSRCWPRPTLRSRQPPTRTRPPGPHSDASACIDTAPHCTFGPGRAGTEPAIPGAQAPGCWSARAGAENRSTGSTRKQKVLDGEAGATPWIGLSLMRVLFRVPHPLVAAPDAGAARRLLDPQGDRARRQHGRQRSGGAGGFNLGRQRGQAVPARAGGSTGLPLPGGPAGDGRPLQPSAARTFPPSRSSNRARRPARPTMFGGSADRQPGPAWSSPSRGRCSRSSGCDRASSGPAPAASTRSPCVPPGRRASWWRTPAAARSRCPRRCGPTWPRTP